MQGRRKKKHHFNIVAVQHVEWRVIRVLLPNLKKCDMNLVFFNTSKDQSHRDRLDIPIFKNSKLKISDQDRYKQAPVQYNPANET